MEGGENIMIRSETGSIVLDGDVSLDPLALPVGGGGFTGGEKSQYKVCICSPSGKIFAIPIPILKASDPSNPKITCDSMPTHWKTHPCEED